MTFKPSDYADFVAAPSPVHSRVTPSYTGAGTGFDVVIIGSGMGGGVMADALAERFKDRNKRVLLLEAGSFLYPTHVYNCSRLDNGEVARRFGCSTFVQPGTDGHEFHIHERPQLNFGGRSVFWSGLIPTVQPWELEFFPDVVRAALTPDRLAQAGGLMNESVGMGATARAIRDRLRASDLANDFVIEETPRALHQPHLRPDGEVAEELYVEPTGVFNTAELLVNQLDFSSDRNPGGDGDGLRMLLNHFVEDVRRLGDGRLEVVARNTLNGEGRAFQAGKVVLAAGSIESPKLLNRSTLGRELPDEVRHLIGRGLTDHPTTDDLKTLATHIGGAPIPEKAMAKIILYSKGEKDGDRVRFPFNVEMNVNHEYWHHRENDPLGPPRPPPHWPIPSVPRRPRDRVVDIKFSFGNCLDPANAIGPAPPFGYVPEILFKNQKWTSHLCGSRFPALAGWRMDDKAVFGLLNGVAERVFALFTRDGLPCAPLERLGENGKGFGSGIVHHAAGSLRMPSKERFDGPWQAASVVDEDLRVKGTDGLFVCDMSVMPFSSAANPVRTLVALALRLSESGRLD